MSLDKSGWYQLVTVFVWHEKGAWISIVLWSVLSLEIQSRVWLYRSTTGLHGIINVTGFYFPFALLFLTSIFPVKTASWLKNCGYTGIHHPWYLQSQSSHLQFRKEWERGGKAKGTCLLSKPLNKLYWKSHPIISAYIPASTLVFKYVLGVKINFW